MRPQKYQEPEQFFKFLIEELQVSVFDNPQRCVAIMMDMLDCNKTLLNLLKTSFINKVYLTLLKAKESSSENKFVCIERALKILSEDLFIDKEKAIWVVGLAASIVYPKEWERFTGKTINNTKEKTKINRNQTIVNPPSENSIDCSIKIVIKTKIQGLKFCIFRNQIVHSFYNHLQAVIRSIDLNGFNNVIFAEPLIDSINSNSTEMDWTFHGCDKAIHYSQASKVQQDKIEKAILEIYSKIESYISENLKKTGKNRDYAQFLSIVGKPPKSNQIWIVNNKPVIVLWGFVDEHNLIDNPKIYLDLTRKVTEEKTDLNSYINLTDKNWIIEDIGLEMVYCPAGSFMMGSPLTEQDIEEQYDDEQDDELQHLVIISKDFYIGKFPITQKQYKSLIGNNPSYFKGVNNPVECINWYEAKEFCQKLNSLYKDKLPIGYNFSLPTEAQWEYACRAGTTSFFNNGNNSSSDELAWYYDNSNKTTHPVGQKKPNAWGIYDMHGNVWEWCEDWYGDYPNYTITNPIGISNGTERVLRGGCWLGSDCYSALRFNYYPDYKKNIIGFRVALVPIK